MRTFEIIMIPNPMNEVVKGVYWEKIIIEADKCDIRNNVGMFLTEKTPNVSELVGAVPVDKCIIKEVDEKPYKT